MGQQALKCDVCAAEASWQRRYSNDASYCDAHARLHPGFGRHNFGEWVCTHCRRAIKRRSRHHSYVGDRAFPICRRLLKRKYMSDLYGERHQLFTRKWDRGISEPEQARLTEVEALLEAEEMRQMKPGLDRLQATASEWAEIAKWVAATSTGKGSPTERALALLEKALEVDTEDGFGTVVEE